MSLTIAYEEKQESVVLGRRPPATETVSQDQELEILRAAIPSLPARRRQIMTWHENYGMEQKEIARELGLSATLVSNQVAKGLGKRVACVRQFRERGGFPVTEDLCRASEEEHPLLGAGEFEIRSRSGRQGHPAAKPAQSRSTFDRD